METAMKIMMVITELGPGGAEKVVLDLTRLLKGAGHENVVVSLKPEPENRKIPDALEKSGIRVVYLNSSKMNPFILFRLASVIKKEKPDLMHSHLIHPNILTRLANRFFRLPLVNTVHIAEQRKGLKLFFLLDRQTFPLCTVCTAVSQAAAKRHEELCHLPPDSIRVIPNAVDPVVPASEELCLQLRNEWKIPGHAKIFGSVGRFNHQKGFDLLLSCLPGVAKTIPDGEFWTFLILGEGQERAALEKQLSGLELPGNIQVLMPGFRSNAASLMNLCDVFVMPSRYEGWPLALAEVMTLGLPVVCNNVPSVAEPCGKYYGTSFLVDFENGDFTAVSDALYMASRCDTRTPQCLMSSPEMLRAYMDTYELAFQSAKK